MIVGKVIIDTTSKLVLHLVQTATPPPPRTLCDPYLCGVASVGSSDYAHLPLMGRCAFSISLPIFKGVYDYE